MYKSPITHVYKATGQINTDTENNVFKTILDYGIVIDKDELIKALAYDREQCRKGFEEGTQTLAELIKEEIPEVNPLYIEYLALKALAIQNSG